MEEGDYNSARELAKWRYEQDAVFHTATVLLQYYVTLVQSDSSNEAEDIKDVFLTVLTGIQTSAIEAEKFGKKLLEDDKPFEAILFYQVAVHYCQSENDVSDLVTCLLRCCAGTSIIVRQEVAKSKLPKAFAKNHIIPYMKQAKTIMSRRLMHNKKEISKAIATLLHCIEQCQHIVDDIDGREATLSEALSVLRSNHGTEVAKIKIFGTCLNNLGSLMLMKDRFVDAQKYFKEAISAHQKAEDYDSVAERRDDIQRSQAGLNAAKTGKCPIQ